MAAMVSTKQEGQSIMEAAIREGVESEKCVVAQHRTTLAQKHTFVQHLASCTSDKIPVEWVIGTLA